LEQVFGNLANQNVFGAVVAGVTGVITVFKNLFGSGEAKKVNDLRDEFQQLTFGTFPAMAKAAQKAGYELSLLLNAKTVKTFTEEMNKLKAAIQFQDDAMQQFDETIKKYNLDIGEVGAVAATRLLGKEAKELYTDFKVLEAGGVDAATAIEGMQDALSKMVRDSISSGVALPKQFEGIIRQMRDLGFLTDDVGEQFSDAELDALKFGGTLTSEIEDLTDAIEKLTEAISRGLGNAIRNLPALPGAGSGLGRNPGGGEEPRLPEGTMAALTGGSAMSLTIPVQIDGREVGRASVTYQNGELRNNTKVRAA